MTGFKRFRTIVTMCAVLGWWGIWFPELAVWADAVCVVEEETDRSTVQQRKEVREICSGLLKADKEQIQIKSRLLQLVEQYLKKK